MNKITKTTLALSLMFVSSLGFPRGLIYESVDALFSNDKRAAAYAVEKGDIEQLAKVIEKFDIAELTGKGGIDLLFLALRKDRYDTFDYLLSKGANIHHQWASGKTTMYWLITANDKKFLKIAKKHKVNFDIDDNGGLVPPIITAIEMRAEHSIHFLLDLGVRLNAKDESGATPLLSAALMDNYVIAWSIYKAGGCLCTKDRSGTDIYRLTNLTLSNPAFRRDSEEYRYLTMLNDAYKEQCSK
ncbi:ankyrin repeat domain-containing protein [Pleionea sp. CnH1-48]|uniref:ankyrin repeat domain-containing protein n=1 Tax=Pleionea sp. CnH1-48 TaxID=2954494 RepID=UPI0020977B3A|nr:ankyrin repeat domain-containing protein [Pleionea sp. CnH1-48]MCO7223008.1 ankyrin repeat domain-containing protein [Pleionea sp. CnH1-48]